MMSGLMHHGPRGIIPLEIKTPRFFEVRWGKRFSSLRELEFALDDFYGLLIDQTNHELFKLSILVMFLSITPACKMLHKILGSGWVYWVYVFMNLDRYQRPKAFGILRDYFF